MASATATKEEFYFIPLDDKNVSLSAIRHELEQFHLAFSMIREEIIHMSHTLPQIDGRVARLMMYNKVLINSIDKQLYQAIPETPVTATAPQVPWRDEMDKAGLNYK
ncbi:hypothetical protein M441DRAFT_336399 [Trichoderma asperellum CBS 433.97]|uniref:Uncharacterized protein n=1 Tax=Trichoderma asperellum (strain ATCC 204424 / CBS 433.97 / NBRC 101777) TaxID=1042311 RepID=A0A2T3ZG74_TRIA4|nr:hypothetical protein M441DRAFT_336399 [Trichoderma asperellum CBS 433.97]PTB43818.1 hypothetical protein M441DRAFT_336399 [Trichoderma asperellum CBS 433.97]